jgi:hypothetical protein
MADEPKTPAQDTPDATVMTSSAPKPAEGTPAQAPAGEPKAGDAKPAEGVKPEGAPVKYDFKLPEGYQIDSKERFAKFEAVLRKADIKPEVAQELVDIAIENGKSAEEAKAAESAKVKTEWLAALKSDPEIGGQNYDATVQYAKRAMKEFANEKFVKFLNDTGFGDNPEMVRAFARIGKKMGEDKFVEGKPSGTPEGKPAADIIYG